jgi:glucose-6-phosphate isomerase
MTLKSQALFTSHLRRLQKLSLNVLVQDPSRNQALQLEVAGVYLDFSKQRIDSRALNALLAWSDSLGWRTAARAMRDGAQINASEGRSVQHMALRADPTPAQFAPAMQQMRALVEALRSGEKRSASGERVVDVIHVGIGGSHLGPQLVCEALAHLPESARVRVHFLANIDGHQVTSLCNALNPNTTALIIASKTMTTLETRLNAEVIREWLGPARVAAQVFAVSAAPELALSMGIRAEHVLPFSDSIGGRFSLWSPIGLPIALQVGWEHFSALLSGARQMDQHFLEAPTNANAPLLMALLGVWNRNGLGYGTLSIAAYDERLRLLPAFLQQLEMESNGKTVSKEGATVAYATAPVLWGQTGTPGQHAYFQWLHQGSDIAPVDFIAASKPDHSYQSLHQALLENCFAQSRALMLGRDHTDPNRKFIGNRPSTTLLLERLTPTTLGALLALYEHKVFVQGHVWNINSFDQFGVELGKAMATQLAGDGADQVALDASTKTLLARVRAQA